MVRSGVLKIAASQLLRRPRFLAHCIISTTSSFYICTSTTPTTSTKAEHEIPIRKATVHSLSFPTIVIAAETTSTDSIAPVSIAQNGLRQVPENPQSNRTRHSRREAQERAVLRLAGLIQRQQKQAIRDAGEYGDLEGSSPSR